LCRIWSRYFAFVRNVLGPLEQAKPWNTAGISGVFGFLKNYGVCIMKKILWWSLMRCQPKTTKTLHKTIKKVADDIENFSFNISFAIHDLR
jgi:leucyl-tRNA synthetase